MGYRGMREEAEQRCLLGCWCEFRVFEAGGRGQGFLEGWGRVWVSKGCRYLD